MPSTRSDIIRENLQTFLQHQHVGRVFFAHPGGSPPQLAYITAFPRLSLTLSGHHSMKIAGATGAEQICPMPGEVVVVLPNRWNKPDWSLPGTVMTFLFGPRQIGISLTSHEGGGGEPRADATASLGRPLDNVTAGLIGTLAELHAAESDSEVNKRVVEALLHSLLVHLEQHTVRVISKPKRTFEAICLFIQENTHSPITRESIADRFGLSPSHVSRLFRTEGSMRFSDYLNLARVNRAKVLLKESRAAIKEIASDCGYTDNAYFCRVFQRFVKMTPTTYRFLR